METGVVKEARFIFKAHKYQLVELKIEFTPTDNKYMAGLMKTCFKVFLDDNFIGYVPLDMLAVLPESKDPQPKLQVILKTSKPANFNFKDVPFTKDMKTAKFLGKIFRQEHMSQIDKDKNHVSLVRDRNTIKRGRRKNKK